MRATVKSALACLIALYFVSPAAATAAQPPESLSYTLPLPPTKGAAPAWGKDPFVPAVSTPGRAAAADMRLTAIFYNPLKPSAIINGSIVYVGSVINSQKVIDIGDTHVILFGASGRIRLEITETPEHTDGAKQKK